MIYNPHKALKMTYSNYDLKNIEIGKFLRLKEYQKHFNAFNFKVLRRISRYKNLIKDLEANYMDLGFNYL